MDKELKTADDVKGVIDTLKNAGIKFQKPNIAVDTLSRQSDPNVQRGVESVNQFQERQPSQTLNADINRAVSTPPPVPVVQTEGDRLRQEADALRQEIAGTDIVGQRQQTREDLQIAQKEERSRVLSNQLVQRQRDIDKQIEQMEKNPEGLGEGALLGRINQFKRESARELADLSFSYNVALGDYQAAEKIANDYMDDLTKELTLKQQSFTNLVNFMSNDMTESETLQAQQAFSEKQAQTSFENQKKMAMFDQTLRQNDPLYKEQVATMEFERTQKEKSIQDALINPNMLTPELQVAIEGLSDGKRKDLLNATETSGQIQTLIDIINTTEDITRLTPFTEEGRKFQRIAEDVADKMARERTGAVVSEDEQKSFKKILGLSFGSQILSDAKELESNLNNFKTKHDNTVRLIDPSGAITNFIGNSTNTMSESTFVDAIDQQLSDPIMSWVSNYYNQN